MRVLNRPPHSLIVALCEISVTFALQVVSYQFESIKVYLFMGGTPARPTGGAEEKRVSFVECSNRYHSASNRLGTQLNQTST